MDKVARCKQQRAGDRASRDDRRAAGRRALPIRGIDSARGMWVSVTWREFGEALCREVLTAGTGVAILVAPWSAAVRAHYRAADREAKTLQSRLASDDPNYTYESISMLK